LRTRGLEAGSFLYRCIFSGCITSALHGSGIAWIHCRQSFIVHRIVEFSEPGSNRMIGTAYGYGTGIGGRTGWSYATREPHEVPQKAYFVKCRSFIKEWFIYHK